MHNNRAIPSDQVRTHVVISSFLFFFDVFTFSYSSGPQFIDLIEQKYGMNRSMR